MQNIGPRCLRPNAAAPKLCGFSPAIPPVAKPQPLGCYKNKIPNSPRQNIPLPPMPAERGQSDVEDPLAPSPFERNMDTFFNCGRRPQARETYYLSPPQVCQMPRCQKDPKKLCDNERYRPCNNERYTPCAVSPKGRINTPCAVPPKDRINQMASPPPLEGLSFWSPNQPDLGKIIYPPPKDSIQECGMETVSSIERYIVAMREALDTKYRQREADEKAYWIEQEERKAEMPSTPQRPIFDRPPRRFEPLACVREPLTKSKEGWFEWRDESSDWEEYRDPIPREKQKPPLLEFLSEEQLRRIEKGKKELSLELDQNIQEINRNSYRSPKRSPSKIDKCFQRNKEHKHRANRCPAQDVMERINAIKRKMALERVEKPHISLGQNIRRKKALERLNAIKRNMAIECLAVLLATPEENDSPTPSEEDLENEKFESLKYLQGFPPLPRQELEDISDTLYDTASSNSNACFEDIGWRDKNRKRSRSFPRKRMYNDSIPETNLGKGPKRSLSFSKVFKECRQVPPHRIRNDLME